MPTSFLWDKLERENRNHFGGGLSLHPFSFPSSLFIPFPFSPFLFSFSLFPIPFPLNAFHRTSTPSDDAVFPPLLEEVFARIEEAQDEGYKVGLSCWDILGNDVVDLFSTDHSKSHSKIFHHFIFLIF